MVNPTLPGASLTTGPVDWQLLQQSAAGVVGFDLAGVYRCVAADLRVEARLVHQDDGRPVAGHDWSAAELEPDARWRLRWPAVPAGGLYRLETRVWRDGVADIRPTRGDFVHHLGVGDLWVIAGQSNASGTGLGSAADPPTLGVHLFGNDEVWKLATHPLEDATRTLHPVTVHGVFQGHAPWLAFGRRLQQRLGYPIGLIPTALGGSPLAMWQPDRQGVLFDNMLAMVQAAGGRVRGLVWYQGESDCQPGSCEDYAARFAGFVAAVREALGVPDLPILTAQLSRFTGPTTASQERCWSLLREAQRQAAQASNVSLVPAIDLPLSDEIHVSTAGNVQLGERFAQTALRVVHGLAEPPAYLALQSLEWLPEQPSRLRCAFTRPAAGWCRPGPIGDFALEDATGLATVAVVGLDDAGRVDLELPRQPVG
ncbi:MAG: sialate O-acetylesterase, partial [Armatimonadetes bacterium]|nr:sialate O-acetylesterase [Armatimonadota bacterium]